MHTEPGVCGGTSGCVFSCSSARRTREPTSVVCPAPVTKSSESHYRAVSRCPFCESFCKASLPWLQSKIVRQLVQ